MENKLNKTNMWKQKQNKEIKKLEFLGSSLRMQEQAYMCRQDYAYAASCPKNLKTQKHGRTSK